MAVSVTLGFMHFAFGRQSEDFFKKAINRVRKVGVICVYVFLSVRFWMLVYFCMCYCSHMHIYVCLHMYWLASFHIYTYFRCLLMGKGEMKDVEIC